ncbi:MAG: hypothetical protein QXF59_03365 [Candidatus Bathyarchaeia archaeon]|nr:CdvA-like protein [Candidatus Bathyarchaeota archaeon]
MSLGSGSDEVRIRCPNCGRRVPAMRYCIYCGAQLPTAAPQRIERPQPMEAPPPVPPLVPPPTPAAPPPSTLESEVASLMSNISTLYTRKISLFKLFQSGEVSEGVFLKIYNEYSGKLGELLNVRVRRLEELRRRLEDVERRLNDIALNLEELSVRYKIGEIDLNTFSQKSEKLKVEQREFESMAKSIRAALNRLEKILGDKSPSEIRDMESDLSAAYNAIKKMAEEGRMSSGVLGSIKVDIEETLALLDSLIRDKKEREKALKEDLEALHARYKIGEITIEEYERKKRELQEEISKVWKE